MPQEFADVKNIGRQGGETKRDGIPPSPIMVARSGRIGAPVSRRVPFGAERSGSGPSSPEAVMAGGGDDMLTGKLSLLLGAVPLAGLGMKFAYC